MVEENEMQTEDVYSRGEHNKIADFFIGFGMYYIASIILSALIFPLQFLFSRIGSMNILMILSPLYFLAWFIPLIVSLILARKYFPERRLVRVGIWVSFALPILLVILLFGACLIALGSGGL